MQSAPPSPTLSAAAPAAPAGQTIHDRCGVACHELSLHEFSCALNRTFLVQGKLYLSDDHLVFYANLFGHETSVVLPLLEITEVCHVQVHLINPGIRVRFGTEKVETFASFFGRDRCFDALSELCDRAHQRERTPSRLSVSKEPPRWLTSCCRCLPDPPLAVRTAIAATSAAARGDAQRRVPKRESSAPSSASAPAAEVPRRAASAPLGWSQPPVAAHGPRGDPTHLGAYPHLMLRLELGCSPDEAHRVMFGDDAFEYEAKVLLGGSEIDVGEWRTWRNKVGEGDAAAPTASGRVREVFWQQSVSMLPKEWLERMGGSNSAQASLLTVSCVPRHGCHMVCGEVRVPDVPFGDAFVLHSKWAMLPPEVAADPTLGAAAGDGSGSSPGSGAGSSSNGSGGGGGRSWLGGKSEGSGGGGGGKCILEVSYDVVWVKPCLLAHIIEQVNLDQARKTYKRMLPLLERHFPGAQMLHVAARRPGSQLMGRDPDSPTTPRPPAQLRPQR